MAFSKEDIQQALQEAGIDVAKQRLVLENLNQVEEEKKEEKEQSKEPKKKAQFVVFAMDDGNLPKDIIGYVLQIPEGKSPSAAPELLADAVRDYNNTARKAKKFPVTTYGDAFRTVKGRFLKESGIKIKTKESIQVIPVNNAINDPKRVRAD